MRRITLALRTLRFALVAATVASTVGAQTQDPFTINSQLASYAVSSCGDLSMSDGVIDSQGLSSSVVGSSGSIVSNSNIKVTGGTINGDAAAGPAKTITTSGSGKITGTRSNESSAYNCTPVDLAALAATLQSANDDSKLPLTGQGKNALGGTTHTDFNLSGGDTIHFPAGTYYFTKFTVSGGSTITIDGPVRILCTGTVSISGGSFVNTDPYRLRFLCSGTQFTISGGSAMVGFVYAPQAAATVSASRLFGSIFAQTVTVSGSAHVTRAIDDVPPRVAITAPANNAIFSDGSKIAVAGTAADDQTALTLKVNGNDVAINADGSWTTTLNLSAAGSPVTITALATDVAGNTATATVTIQIIPPPVITLVSPPNGALVNTRSVTLTGSAGTAAAVTVNGQSAALVSGTWTIQNFDLGNDGAHALTIVGTNAGGATTISATITNDTAAPTIQGTFTPAPNADGWNNTNVTVTFACADSGSGIATCQAPITVSTEGANQTITGTATDKAGNQKTVSVTVKLDATAPQVAITAPANGTSVSSPSLSVSGAASDALSGLAGVTCNGAAATVSGGSFTCTVMLSAGDDAITVRATDLAGNSATDSRHVSLATLNSISVSPASASIVVGGTVALAAQATYSDGTTRDVTAAAAWSSSAANVANVSGGAVNAIGSGTAVITATLNGISGSATVTVTKPAPTFTAINVLPSSATLQRGATQQLTATATYSDDSTADVTAQSTWTTSASAVATVAATGLVTAAGEGSAVITATLGSTSGTATITVPPAEPLPPDPATVAPPIDATAGANVHESTRFLYEGTNSIQTGVAPNTIDPLRAAVIRGRVIQRGGSPLAAVHITILGHGEYGRTLTRADGQFDCAVNGGGAITVQYRKDGYVPVDRQATTTANDYAAVNDVVMVPLDPSVTAVDLTTPGLKVVRGSTSTDTSGTRTATIFFPPSTSATMTLPNGATQQLTSLNIRATEYTVGSDGSAAMPAALPPQSAYTYCVELSADEAIAAGATRLDFSKALPFYVENFLNFPVGDAVPVGYYDRDRGVWIPSLDGRVIQIVAIVDGRASLDVTGDGVADDSDALIGTTPAERETLAALYPVGKSLWRVVVTHFTPFDLNWPLKLPADAVTPDGRPEYRPCEQCDHQTVTDAVATPGAPPDPTSGTPVLHYRSDRSAGRVASRVIDVPVSGASVPQSLLRIETEIAVAGTLTRQTFPPSAGQRYRFTWDGRDVYGRTVQGAAPVSVRTSYVYQGTYERPASSGASFDLASGVSIGIPARSTVTTSAVWLGQLGAWDAAGERMGGFTVAPHHFYDVVSKTLYRGDGTFTTDRPVLFGELSGTVSTIAGTGINDPNWSNVGKLALNKPIGFAGALAVGPDGSLYISSQNYIHRITPAGILERVAGGGTAALPDIGTKAALDAHLSFPRGMAFGPDGSLYVADQFNYIVRRITPDGITSTFAGTGRGAVGPDGVPATNSELARPVDVSVTKDGVVYIVDQGGVVRRVGTDGIITTIAGSNSASGASGDGGPARDALFLRPAAIAVGDDGNVYVEDTDAARIRRIAPDGVVSTFAGNGAYDSTGDTGPAVAASLKLRDTDGNLLAMASDGSLIVPEADGSKIRRIDPAGIITTIAGTGVTQNGPDGSLATGTNLNPPSAVAVAPDGTVYFATSDGLFIRKITPVLPRNTASQSEITVGDGGLVHVFDAAGRHLRTLNRDTGGVLYQFQYDASHLLTSMTDVDGNLTTIERTANGDATAIINPGGQRTEMSVSPTSTTITTAPGEQTTFNFQSGGLLSSKTDPRGNVTSFTWNDLGMQGGETDAERGSTTLARTDSTNSHTVTQTTAEGRSLVFTTTTNAVGDTTESTAIAGLTTTTTHRNDGVVTTSSADGSTNTARQVGDPVWGMQSPYSAATTWSWPSGRTLNVTLQRQATLSNPADRLSLVSRSDTLTIAGKSYTRAFTRSTLTETTTTPLGRKTTRTFDLAGRTKNVTPSGLAPIAFGYDSHGRLNALTQDSRQQTFAYNDTNQLTSITDALQRTTRFEYDGAGRVLKQIVPDGREINFVYDAAGNLTSLTPPGRPPYAFDYTKLNLTSHYTPPALSSEGVTNYLYDKDRHLTSIEQPGGSTISMSYDAAGRLGSMNWPGHVLSYHYLGTGTLGSIDGADASLTYTYDGSLPLSMSWRGAVQGTVSWTYDQSLHVASETAAGQSVTFGYNDDGQLTAAGDLQIFYRANGLPNYADFGPGGNTEDWFDFNQYGEQKRRGIWYGGSDRLVFVYDRDNAGRITGITNYDTYRQAVLLGQVGYSYDAAGRLQDVTSPTSTVHYEYDANGNRTSRQATVDGTTTTETATYDAQDRLLTYGGAQYSYAANGELMSKTDASGTTQYEYDALGNLRRVTLPNAEVIDYVIDAENRRVGKKVNGTLVRQWLYADQLRIVAELDGSGTPISRFVYGVRSNVPDYMIRDGVGYRIFSDHLGSPRFVVNATDTTVVETRMYDEFGNVLSDSNPDFQPFAFAGGLYDADTQLVRFGARDYDPHTGRWTTKDPILFGGNSPNLYSYTSNDPINLLDPTGLVENVQQPGFTKPLSSTDGPSIPDAFGTRAPDFIAANVNIAIPTPLTGTLLGWSGTAALDRFGNWYWSVFGGGVGKSATTVSGSCTLNWVNQKGKPSRKQLQDFLTQHGLSATAGFWAGVTESYTPGSGWTTGFGVVTPQIGVSYNYSYQGGSNGAHW